MRLTIVDVFAESRWSGNQLAVVRDAQSLDGASMQAIAREMNFSETTFVVSEGPERARVRIFTPGQELPFAGHPTVGTAWVLGRQRGQFTLDLDVGPVTVEFESPEGVAWMRPPEARFGPDLDRSRAAAVIGVAIDALHPDWPPTFVDLGPRFLFVPVRSRADVSAAVLDLGVRARLLGAGLPADAVFVFAPEGYSADGDFSARLFFDAGGVREDPATGSANSALACYVRRYRAAPFRAVVEQGFEIQRPSRLYLDVGLAGYRVGGRVRLVAEGTLY
jgi:trans-2,3-dihydro-3-hydroxyanthranilate isomerase